MKILLKYLQELLINISISAATNDAKYTKLYQAKQYDWENFYVDKHLGWLASLCKQAFCANFRNAKFRFWRNDRK